MLFDAWPLLAAPAIREPLFQGTRVPLWAMELTASVLLHLWLFCVGACVGSFLNVVVYRLPRGKSLSHPGSCCPQCGHAIRLNDNVPILSWLCLWGRCRDCRAPISPRYFWVELLVACVFLGVAFWERTELTGTFGWFPLRPKLAAYDAWPYWTRYATHVVEITTLLGGVLMLGDGFRPPTRLFIPTILLSFGLPIVWPEIRSIPAWSYGQLPGWQQGLIDGLFGSAASLWLPPLAIVLWRSRLVPRTQVFVRAMPTLAVWAMSIGVVLGWQRTLLFGVPILVLYLYVAHVLFRFRPNRAAPSLPTPEELPSSDPLNPEP